MEKLLALIAKTTMTSYKNNKKFIHPKIHSQYWMKNVHFHFTFPSKHVIITNYGHIYDFIQLFQHYSCICDYNSHIYDDTHLPVK